MGFQTISVKEAVNNINANLNGWFLPAVQRPYVWGSRYESEKYICKLFDSILNGYPIGTLIVWNTDKEVPYREFMNDYEDGKIATLVDKSLWERTDKWLVYDGQQRLQTLFSCLKYTLNKRILAYNLLYKSDNTDEDYGFEFIDKNTDNPGYIKLPALFSKTDAEKVSYRKKIQKTLTSLTEDEETLFETRFDKLWSVFVGTDVKSLAYFPIDSTWNEDKVNEFLDKAESADGFVFGSPVHFAAASVAITSFLDRVFYGRGNIFARKACASVVSCRRGGAVGAFDQLNKYALMSNMYVVGSSYWNQIHGTNKEEAMQDLEGLQTMRNLGKNMAYLIKSIKQANIEKTEIEKGTKTNFIR